MNEAALATQHSFSQAVTVEDNVRQEAAAPGPEQAVFQLKQAAIEAVAAAAKWCKLGTMYCVLWRWQVRVPPAHTGTAHTVAVPARHHASGGLHWCSTCLASCLISCAAKLRSCTRIHPHAAPAAHSLPSQICEGAASRACDWGDLVFCDATTKRWLVVQTSPIPGSSPEQQPAAPTASSSSRCCATSAMRLSGCAAVPSPAPRQCCRRGCWRRRRCRLSAASVLCRCALLPCFFLRSLRRLVCPACHGRMLPTERAACAQPSAAERAAPMHQPLPLNPR